MKVDEISGKNNTCCRHIGWHSTSNTFGCVNESFEKSFSVGYMLMFLKGEQYNENNLGGLFQQTGLLSVLTCIFRFK